MKRCCEVRRKLAEEFATAARLYAEAVVALTRFQTKEGEYDRCREAAEQAQVRTRQASAAFEEHEDSHRCASGDWTDADKSTARNYKASANG